MDVDSRPARQGRPGNRSVRDFPRAAFQSGKAHHFPESLFTIRERMYMQGGSLTMRCRHYSEAFRRKDGAAISDLYRSNDFRDSR